MWSGLLVMTQWLAPGLSKSENCPTNVWVHWDYHGQKVPSCDRKYPWRSQSKKYIKDWSFQWNKQSTSSQAVAVFQPVLLGILSEVWTRNEKLLDVLPQRHLHMVFWSLTNEAPEPQWPLVGRSIAAEEVDGNPWQGNPNADQGVDGVAVERHHHQEDGEDAENDGVEETELQEDEERRGLKEEPGFDGMFFGSVYVLPSVVSSCPAASTADTVAQKWTDPQRASSWNCSSWSTWRHLLHTSR